MTVQFVKSIGAVCIPCSHCAVTRRSHQVLAVVEKEIWSELEKADGKSTDREPMISSLRRNLQREYVERLIDLSMPGSLGENGGNEQTFSRPSLGAGCE